MKLATLEHDGFDWDDGKEKEAYEREIKKLKENK